MKKTLCPALATILLALLLLLPMSGAEASEITVAAANSICGPLKKAGEIFSQQQGLDIHYICKSSGILAKGLESGYITADYFISANQKWMDYLTSSKLIDPTTVKSLWDNTIVAAASKKSTINLQSWEDLTTPAVTTVLIGDPSTTPLGRQFKNAMLERGLWLKIRPKIVSLKHMSLTKDTLAAANNTTIGILFPTSIDNRIKPVLAMPPEWHAPIRYYAGILYGSPNKKETAAFAAFIKSTTANAIFHHKGYIILPTHKQE